MDRGIVFPIQRGDNGYFRKATGIDLIRGNILQIFGTIPGERVNLPDFGSLLRELLFEIVDETTLILARTYAIDAIKKWEKRVVMIDAEVMGLPEQSAFAIRAKYRYIESGENETMTVVLEKGGIAGWQV